MADDTPAPDAAPTPDGGDDPTEAIDAAAQAVTELGDQAAAAAGLDLPEFDRRPVDGDGTPMELLGDVELNVSVELGRTRMFVEDVLRLASDCIVELDKLAGDPVDIYVNGQHVARGEVLVVNENFCVRVSEILKDPAIRA